MARVWYARELADEILIPCVLRDCRGTTSMKLKGSRVASAVLATSVRYLPRGDGAPAPSSPRIFCKVFVPFETICNER